MSPSRKLLLSLPVCMAVLGAGILLYKKQPLASQTSEPSKLPAKPARPNAVIPLRTPEEIKATAEARPCDRTVLTYLDLSRPPTESELIKAGNLGEPLTPTASADAGAIEDPAKRVRMEQINLAFGHTIQAWNQHRYQEAFALFEKHISEFPDSPWKAESELHLGCYCQYNGRLMEAAEWFDKILSSAETKSEMYHKAKLRRSILHLDQGNLEASLQGFSEMMQDDKDPGHQSYASYWIREIALLQKNETAMRDCGQKALARVAEISGDSTEALALRELSAAGPHGFTARELHLTALQYGLDSRPVRADAALEDLPLPFVAHYQDHHYVTVEGISKDTVKLYDSRVGEAEIPLAAFRKQWSGFAMIFSDPQPTAAIHPAENLDTIVGGCCGYPRSPSDLGDDGCGKNCGMPGWSVNPVNFNFRVSDTPMWWEPPVGPSVHMSLLFNSLDSLNNVSMFGGKWSFEYASHLMITPGVSPQVQVKDGDGRQETFASGSTAGVYPVTFTSPAGNFRTLKETADHVYTLTHQDGTIYHYGIPLAQAGNSSVPLLLAIEDRHGNALHITHNAQGAITEISHTMLPATVATGGVPSEERKWLFTYDTFGGHSRVKRINDPFGREATFGYDEEGYLRTQTDMGGLQYGYDYTIKSAQDSVSVVRNQTVFGAATSQLLISAIHTPKGTTEILTEPSNGVSGFMPTTAQTSQGYSPSYPPVGSDKMWTNYRIRITNPETFTEEYYFDGDRKFGYYRDPVQLKRNPGQKVNPPTGANTRYTYDIVGGIKGKIIETHVYDANGNENTRLSKNVMEYSATTQQKTGIRNSALNWTRFDYNPNGTVKVIKLPDTDGSATDPQKIHFTYETIVGNETDRDKIQRYWNGSLQTLLDIDYWTGTRDVKQTKDVLNHVTTYHWHSNGLPEKIIDETTGDMISYAYDQGSGPNNPDDYPTWRLIKVNKIIPASGSSPAISTLLSETGYDDIGRPAMVRNADDIYYQPAFDDLNRLKRTDYSDGTFSEQIWECCHVSETRSGTFVGTVDHVKDRMVLFYDKRGLPVRSIDTSGKITRVGYDDAGYMTTLTDPLDQVTTWSYDAFRRLDKKIYPNTKFEQIIWANLEQPSKFKNRRGLDTTVSFDYNGNLKTVTGTGVNITRTYDDWDRLKTIKDTTYSSVVHTYDYDLSGRITSLDGPWNDDTIGWQYLDSERKVVRTTPGSVTETIIGDKHGRISSSANPLGTFTPAYDDDIVNMRFSNRMLSLVHSGGFNTSFGYHGPAFDRTLESVTSKLPNGNTVGKHTYGYDDEGRVDSWKREASLANPIGGTRSFTWKSHYDFASQITTIAETSLTSSARSGWDYGYDLAGNITTVQNSGGSSATISNRQHNSLNQISTIGGGGPTLVRGTMSKPGQASVGIVGSGDHPARMLDGNRFETELPLSVGSNSLSIAATDNSGNRSNYQFSVGIANPGPYTFSYDDDGNLKSDGVRSYDWDILSRLTKITWAAGKTTDFKYNGLGQRCERIDTDGSTVTKHYYLINGSDLIHHRSGPTAAASAAIDRRYFSQGEQRINGTTWENYFYCRDHLGSIREVVKSVGTTNTLVARYDYEPYGKRLDQFESTAYVGGCDFGYTGHLTVPSLASGQSEIVLTLVRAYDPVLGRWLSADPLGEEGGMNLYAYVAGNPLNFYDPFGLEGEFWSWGGTAGEWAENSANFVAGFGDSATFGLTDIVRDQIYGKDGNNVDKCGDSYKWGERTQVASDLATLGVSGGLKLALKAKGKQIARKEANKAIRGLVPTQHHVNTVIGHPGVPGIASHFPLGGLPASIHSGSWNLRQVAAGLKRGEMSAEHLRLHQRALIAETVAMGNAAAGPGRAIRNALQDGDCE